MHHCTVTIPDGRIYIIGGTKTDGSDNALSDHYLFDVNVPSFTQLSSTNGPPDIYGHACIILPDGRLLVFGGYSQSQGRHIPFDVIWVLDTTKDSGTPEWTLLAVSTSNLPSPRRAFAAVLLPDGRILIHGGSDAHLQFNFEDGWILDLSQDSAVWTKVDPLSQLGARRDHFAVASGNEVIFGFGYQNNAPAPAPLSIYDPTASTFAPSHTPPPAKPTGSPAPSPTLPGMSQTPAGPTPTGKSGVHPTATVGPGGGNSDGNGNGNGNGGNGGGANGDDESRDRQRATAIAVGTAFGVIGLLLVVGGVIWYYRRQSRERWAQGQFAPLTDDDDLGRGASPGSGLNSADLPQPAMMGEKGQSDRIRGGLGANFSSASLPPGNSWGPTTVLGALGLAGLLGINGQHNPRPLRRVRTPPERRDMLADEDTRMFNASDYEGRRREPSAGSTWSLLSMIGAGGSTGGRRGFFSREPSAVTLQGVTPASEKLDPFDVDEEGYVSVGGPYHHPRRPSARREQSYASTRSGGTLGYVDPFADPIQEEPRDVAEQLFHDAGHQRDISTASTWRDTYYNHPPPLSSLNTMTPMPTGQPHVLSPLSEHTSRATLSLADPTNSSISSHDQGQPPSPFEGTRPSSSHTSLSVGFHQMGSSPRPSSILDPSPNPSGTILSAAPTQPMRRSDTWWTRFSRTSFLDRRASDASRRSGTGAMPDIRDPNPPPRLNPIEESQNSGSANESPEGSKDSPKGASLIKGSLRRGKGSHAKSTSSLQTAHTADSEAIERMGGRIDVALRVRSRAGRESTGSTVSSHAGSYFDRMDGDADADELAAVYEVQSPAEMNASDVAFAAAQGLPLPLTPDKTPSPGRTPPKVSTPSASSTASSTSLGSDGKPKRPPMPRPPSGRAVAARVQEYERRMSQDVEPPSPASGRSAEDRGHKKHKPSVDYGLVPRASLFIANPDKRASDDS
ncbi:hypothetical protein HGRIS_004507 [Hohenbuehelia grisea]